MTAYKPVVLDATGEATQLPYMGVAALSGGVSIAVGAQSEGPIIQPQDILNFTNTGWVVTGFLSPIMAGFTSTMTNVVTQQGCSPTHLAYVYGYRVQIPVGDSRLTYTYTANKDTYDDVDWQGNITHVAVNNNAAAPTVTVHSLRLQKVVTNGTQVTSVTQLAATAPSYLNVASGSSKFILSQADANLPNAYALVQGSGIAVNFSSSPNLAAVSLAAESAYSILGNNTAVSAAPLLFKQ